MKPRTLRVQLTMWFVGSLLAILAPVLVVLATLEWRGMRAALDHHLEEDLEVAAEMLVLSGGGVTWRTDATQDLGYDAGPQRWVEVYTLNGQPLYFRGVPSRPEIRASLQSPSAESSGYRTVRTPAGAFTRVLTSDRRLGGLPVWLRVARSEDELRSDLRILILIFSVLAPISVLGAALAGYVISGRALAPLSRMAERARTISADRLSERLPVELASDELGQLAAVFNETFARLEASFERLRRFTADASHQLRTPLTALKSVGEVGLREAKAPRDYEETIGSMLEEADRLAALVDALLLLSRWESGRVPRTPTHVDLADLARAVCAQLAVLAEERRVSLEVDAVSVIACVDDVMCRSALMNVVDNAIKFTPDGGRVRVWTRPAHPWPELVVDDTGPGIPETDRERVLERFARGSQADTASARPGVGLGLAIADWAIRANHGRLSVEGNEQGGARVVIRLPAADALPPSA